MRAGLMLFTLVAGLATSSISYADSAESRCDIYKAGDDNAEKMIACTFSQRSGYITINRSDGVVHELSPKGDTPGSLPIRIATWFIARVIWAIRA